MAELETRFPDSEGAPPGGDPRRRRPPAAVGAVLIAALGALALLAGCGDDSSGGGGTTTDGAGQASACAEVEAPAPKQVDLERPTAKAPSGSAVVFETSCGSFTVTLDADRAPRTAASFEYLAEQGVFDGTGFHRVVPGFVVQGGDPAGDGTGGPGYSIRERPPADLVYSRGLVAMAKTAAEPPGTSGSQFFIVTAPADAGLPPDYAPVGEVTEGFDTVLAIEALAPGPGSDGPPSRPVVIESATVTG